jgi:hypothetical protein
MRTVIYATPWWECLVPAAQLLSGNDYVVEPRISEPCLLLGAHNLPRGAVLPEGTVIFNTEHISCWSEDYRDLMSRYRTLSYSATALAPRARYCPLTRGEIPRLTLNPTPDVYVLFFGSRNPRRNVILKGLEAAGLTVQSLFGSFGVDLESHIKRAKVVLNCHFYTNPPAYESSRVVPLLHSGVCVLSEASDERDYVAPASVVARYENLIGEAWRLCKSDDLRLHKAFESAALLQALPEQRDILRVALEGL